MEHAGDLIRGSVLVEVVWEVVVLIDVDWSVMGHMIGVLF